MKPRNINSHIETEKSRQEQYNELNINTLNTIYICQSLNNTDM